MMHLFMYIQPLLADLSIAEWWKWAQDVLAVVCHAEASLLHLETSDTHSN